MRSISNLYGSLQKLLIEPPAHIRDVELRHKSRLLNIFLLPMILVFMGVDAVYLLTVPGYVPPWYGYVLLIASYLLNRGRFYRFAAFLTLVMFPFVILVNIVSGGSTDPLQPLQRFVQKSSLLEIGNQPRNRFVDLCYLLSMPFF